MFLFANTGQEHEKTLEFVDKCDKAWNLNVHWIETVVHYNQRKSSTGARVNFKRGQKTFKGRSRTRRRRSGAGL